jgi:hypothetical protein
MLAVAPQLLRQLGFDVENLADHLLARHRAGRVCRVLPVRGRSFATTRCGEIDRS